MIRVRKVRVHRGVIVGVKFHCPKAEDERRYAASMAVANSRPTSWPSLLHLMVARPERN